MNAPRRTETEEDGAEIERAVRQVGERAKAAGARLAQSTRRAAQPRARRRRRRDPRASRGLVEANQEDMAAAEKQSLTAAMLDRLRLDAERIEAMADGR